MQGPGTFSNLDVNTLVAAGPAGTVVGVFVYAPGTIPALGNLPIAWVTQSSQDPFGNNLPQGPGPAGGAPAKDVVTFDSTTSTLAWLTKGALRLMVTTDSNPASVAVLGGSLSITSPTTTAADIPAVVQFNSTLSPRGNGVNPEIQLQNNTSIRTNGGAVPVKGGLSVTGGETTDTTHVTGTSTLDGAVTVNAKETITAGGLAVTGGTTTDTETVTGQLTATGGSAGTPTKVTTDTWNTMTLTGGWTAGGYARYRLNPDRTVEIQGVISAGTLTNGTSIWTAPAGYVPTLNQTQNIPVMVETSTGAAGVLTPRLGIGLAGNLFIENIPTGTTLIGFNGRYSLD